MNDYNENEMKQSVGSNALSDFEASTKRIFEESELSGDASIKIINMSYTDVINRALAETLEVEQRRAEEEQKRLWRNTIFISIVGGIIFGLAAWNKKV